MSDRKDYQGNVGFRLSRFLDGCPAAPDADHRFAVDPEYRWELVRDWVATTIAWSSRDAKNALAAGETLVCSSASWTSIFIHDVFDSDGRHVSVRPYWFFGGVRMSDL